MVSNPGEVAICPTITDKSSALPLGISLLSLSTSLARKVAVSLYPAPLLIILAPAHPHPTGPHAQPLFATQHLSPILHCTRLQYVSPRPPQSPTPSHPSFIPISVSFYPSSDPLPQEAFAYTLATWPFLSTLLQPWAVISCPLLSLSPWPGDSVRQERTLPSCSLLNHQTLGTITTCSRHRVNIYCSHIVVDSFFIFHITVSSRRTGSQYFRPLDTQDWGQSLIQDKETWRS